MTLETLEDKDLFLKSLGKFSLYLDRKDPGISKTLEKPKYFRKWHREPEFMDIIESEVNPGDVAFDLGANIGYVTMHLAQYVGPSGKVYAVEPSPRNFQILKRSVEVNGVEDRVEIQQLAISSSSGTRKLNISAESNLNSFAETKYTKKTIDVKTTSIDDFFALRRFPNFIKMDIEGAEVDALAGIDGILSESDKPLKILMEVHPMYYNGDDFARQLNRLFDRGFTTKYLVSAGSARPPYFTSKGYEPTKIYQTGDWSRGVYKNIENKHVVESCSKLFDDNHVSLPFASLIKNPTRITNRKVTSPKIVRAIMIERK